jgi:lipopolysaccharide biosynthesis glycosyltransferase
MLRLEIPYLFSNCNEKVLYTDVDVMFLDDPSKYIFDTQLFAFSSEFEYDNFVNINTGVIILDLDGAKKEFQEF